MVARVHASKRDWVGLKSEVTIMKGAMTIISAKTIRAKAMIPAVTAAKTAERTKKMAPSTAPRSATNLPSFYIGNGRIGAGSGVFDIRAMSFHRSDLSTNSANAETLRQVLNIA